ncbi:uncharacterized protein TRIADDRAFT_23629 [Trichoplax adhaerens]|uniref:Pseudouridylate synthase 7 homolog n=1 Tax=Trichoplax adhaerens TaxID=10228 RepID=B3RVM0_TRIAD|nr:hypothetical protein TRIADDRAFT_23629 [Trichoplax adhaerens]EDV26019.1 hypothetical protein TRIADDRAFT_23629 [Trichoplax adhaerens]|eukprot:XP_002112052.1 hypothetical protein TRIADDRAFT_23629 [Trichoplax adhaerens]
MPPVAKRAKIAEAEEAQHLADNEPSLISEDVDFNDDNINADENDDNIDFYQADLSPLENDVGITEYISQLDPIQGSIKQRFADFIVHEINLDGQIVKLENLDLPTSTEEIIEDTDNMISTDLENRLQELSSSHSSKKSVIIDLKENESNKEWRTKMHNLIRQRHPDLESTTMMEDDNKKYIKVTKNQKGLKKSVFAVFLHLETGIDICKRIRWPNEHDKYCKFRLYKENIDTMNAINLICKFTGLKPSIFGYAGTKDRRAITTQEITAFKVLPSKLHHVNSVTHKVRLGNFTYSKDRLTLGDLAGNHFTLTLRNVKGSEEQIEKSMASLKETGFINYYGLQRFGTSHIPTYQIGKALLLGNWRKSIELILKPTRTDSFRTMEAREHWWQHRDPSAALRLLRSRRGIEYYLLKGLVEHGSTSPVTAIMKIPRNARLLYVYSYQSLIWNLVASRRIKEFGLKPVVGDLVISNSARQQDLPHYSIHDIVLPLPGYNVMYPQHEANDWYHQQMKADGISIKNLENRHKEFSLCGMYRKLVVRPKNLSWSTARYDDFTIPLYSTDLDQIRQNKIINNSVADGKNLALLLSFSLPPSSYATMALREVMRYDTSWYQQKKLASEFTKSQEEATKVN